MEGPASDASGRLAPPPSALRVFCVCLGLGLRAFGGPAAHLGYFRQTFVSRLKWLEEGAFAQLVALCSVLPGLTSSQVSFAIGLSQAGFAGGLGAFIGFSLPSVMMMFAAASGLELVPATLRAPIIHGLILVSVPVIAQAVWGMAARLCSRLTGMAIALLTAAGLLLADQPWLGPACILAAGLAGARLIPAAAPSGRLPGAWVSQGAGRACLSLFLLLLAGLPLAAWLAPSPIVLLADGFYRSGALVFGGGHVILPLLEQETVGRGWLEAERFLAGYGAAQALPGPLGAFSMYLGAASDTGLPGILAGLISVAGLFAPGFLLVAGVLPVWSRLSEQSWMPGFAAGAGAAVTGLLAAALWRPVITTAVVSPADAAIACAGFLALQLRAPVWLTLVLTALAGAGVSAAGL